jgi:hypothetical protein
MVVKKSLTNENSKECFGITNLTSDGYFIPFFDYDDTSLLRVKNDLLRIQDRFKLSDIYIIKSNNGYNAFSLDKLSFTLLNNIMDSSKIMDKKFIKLALERKFFVLRVGNDKKITQILPNKTYWQKSLCHALALRVFYKHEIDINYLEYDENTLMRMYLYKSEKDGYLRIMK